MYKCSVCGAYTEEPVHCGRPASLLMTGEQRLRLSKLVSFLLRHGPWEACLEPDEEGWVQLDELVRGIRRCWRNREAYQWVTREHILALAALDPKGRFEVHGDRIRARYGHSIQVVYRLEPDPNPPRILYHGTVRRNLPSIMRQGLLPMKRRMVHMTVDPRDAYETGRRHGPDVVILEVDTECLARRGVPVYKAGKTVYMAPRVPPECIRVRG
nr:RNA 2'-phosphotransferase [Pyrolobus fumarii]